MTLPNYASETLSLLEKHPPRHLRWDGFGIVKQSTKRMKTFKVENAMTTTKMPFSRSLIWILVSTLLISGSAFMGWLYFLHVKERRLHDDQYRIVAIIQSTPQADALKTLYLAELLGLSLDRPINLYQFNAKEAAQTLLSHPLIKNKCNGQKNFTWDPVDSLPDANSCCLCWRFYQYSCG